MRSPVLAFVGIAVLFASLASAEETKPQSVGTRVRIHAGAVEEIPGVLALGTRYVNTKGVVVQDDTQLVAVKVPEWNDPVCLPRPHEVLTGRLVAQDDESLTIAFDGRKDPYRVPREVVRRLEVSTGQKSRGSRVAKGAGIGLLVGGAVGAVLGAASGGSCSGGCIPDSGEGAAVGGIAGGLAGLVLGTAFGLAGSTDLWREVPTNHVQVRLVPVRRGAGVTVALAY